MRGEGGRVKVPHIVEWGTRGEDHTSLMPCVRPRHSDSRGVQGRQWGTARACSRRGRVVGVHTHVRVVGASGKLLGDLGPLVAQRPLQLHDDAVLFRGPRALLDARVELVVPPLAALLAIAPFELRGDRRPVARTVLADDRRDLAVLFLGPRLFHLRGWDGRRGGSAVCVRC